MKYIKKVVKFILFGTALASACAAAQSIALTNGAQASGTFPGNPAFTSIGAIRMEFRLHGFTQPADYFGWIFQFGQFYARFYQSSMILNLTDNSDVNAFTNLDLTGRTDVLVRFQRDQANNRLTMEAWNAIDGAGYVYAVYPLAAVNPVNLAGTPMAIGAPTTSTNLAYLRMYSTVLPLNSPPPSRTNGNLGDWEFEGSLNDKSGQGINLSGTVSYVATPSYPISISLGQFGTPRVWNPTQGPIALNGSATYSSVDDPTYTYSWSQASGPGSGSFSTPTGATTNFTASLPGDYQIGLTASDGVTANSLVIDVGAVNTNAQGTVQTGNPAMDVALGPLSMWGTSPWPWYDFTEMADADALYTLVTTPPTYGMSALTGTVTATNGSATVAGVGTHFLSDIVGCIGAGATTAQTCTNANIASYASMGNRDYFWIPNVTTVASPTINVNSFGAVTITSGCPCTAGHIYLLNYSAASGGSFSAGVGVPLVWFWWNAPDGTGTGRYLLPVGAIASDTSLTLYYGPYSGPVASGVQYSNPSEPELGTYWNYTGQPSNNLNYYDVVHGLYKLYYRTNLTKYLTEARTLADNWYQYATAQGYYYGAPRAMGWLGMIDRAIDGHPTIWQGLDQYFTSALTNTLFNYTTPRAVGFQFDTRETGYETRYVARMAALDPTTGAKALACSNLHNIVANVYNPVQDSFGQWEVDGFSENPDVPGAMLNGKFGSSPWRDAMSGLALEESYDILTNNCGDSATAALALSTVTKQANFTHDYGQGTLSGGGVGQFGNVMYGSMIETNIHASYIATPVQDIAPLTTGTLAVTVGSSVVVGTGTNFTSVFSAIYKGSAPQVGIDPTFIGIPGLFSSSCSQVLPVASVTDDTHLTLAATWPCASASNINANGFGWIGAPSASTNCALFGSIATTCEGPIDPSLSHEVHAMWSWLYWKTGNGKYMTWAQQSAGTDYGGSSGGPGSSLPPAGPFATGSTGNFLSSLPPCGSTPCGGYGAAIALGKDFGFSAGAGNANNAMAYLILGGSSSGVPSSQTITFAAPSSVAVGSAPFNLQATASSGLPVTFASTTTPVCTVSGAIVSLVAPGTCSITATQPGSTNFAAAAPVVQSFIVTTGSQAITFAAPASVAAGSAPFTLQATASSGLPVSFASNTSNICTVSGTTVTVIAIGVCSITASQAGNTTFAAAAPVVQSFTVTNGSQTPATSYTVSQNGNWHTATSFTPNGIPGFGDTVTNNQYTLVCESGQTCNLGTINSTSLTIGDGTHAASMVVNGTLVLRGQGTMNGPYYDCTHSPSVILGTGSTMELDENNGSASSGFVIPSGTAPCTQFIFGTSGDVCTWAPGSITCPTNLTSINNGSANGILLRDNGTAYGNSITNWNGTAIANCGVASTTVAGCYQVEMYNTGTSWAWNQVYLNGDAALGANINTGVFSNLTPITINAAVSMGRVQATDVYLGSECNAGAYTPIYIPACTGVRSVTNSIIADMNYNGTGGDPFTAGLPVQNVYWDGLQSDYEGLTASNVAGGSWSYVVVSNPGGCYAGNSSFPAILAPTADHVYSFCTNTGPTPNRETVNLKMPSSVNWGTNVVATNFMFDDQTHDTGFGHCFLAAQGGNADSGYGFSLDHMLVIADSITGYGGCAFAGWSGGCQAAPMFSITHLTTPSVGNGHYPYYFCDGNNIASTAPELSIFKYNIFAGVAAGSGGPVGTPNQQATQPANLLPPTGADYNVNWNFTPAILSYYTTACVPSCSNVGSPYALPMTGSAPGQHDMNVNPALTNSAINGYTWAQTKGQAGTAAGFKQAFVDGGPSQIQANLQNLFSYICGGYTPLNTAMWHIDPDSTTPGMCEPQSQSQTPGSQTITFAAPATVAVDSAPFNLQATASSGLPVTFVSTTTPVCRVSGTTASLVAPGTCSITATQPGNTSFAAAAPVVQSFIVTPASQTITFATPASVAAGSAPFTLQATASSGLLVTFASNTLNICTVSGTTVTVIAIGVCSITASQAGNPSFAEAVPVVRSFTVSAGKAAFITTDITTQGTWKGVYGADGEAIDSDSAQYPGYSQVSFSGDASFVWNLDTADPRALQKSAGTDRIASTWYTSLNMSIDVNLVDGDTHQVALYCLDWDGEGSRAERVDVLDASSGAVLDTRSITGFQGGQYLVWNLTGHVTLRITPTAGNGVVSGVFFDPPAPKLVISSLHAGNFTQGQNGAVYSVAVSNGAGAANTRGAVTVTDVVPTGLTLVSMSGVGWTCLPVPTCTTSDVLAAGQSYNPIAVTVNVAANASPAVTNQVSVNGGGSTAASASDLTVIAANGGPVTAGKAAFITADTTTQGTWKGVYGADGEAIDSDSTQYPGYSQVSFSGDASFVWNLDTADPRALQKSAGTDRIASTWYTSLNMSVDVNLVDGYTHQVALYCLDWDGEGSRAERVDVLDASSGAVLDTRSMANFQGGQYLVWNLTGHVTLRITYTAGANAVVSGLFFDPNKTP